MDVNPPMWEKPHNLSGERAKDHAKSTTLAIHKHCTDFHHPLPSVTNFAILDKDSLSDHSERPKKLYIFEDWTQISTGTLVKCSFLTVLTL